MASVTMVFEVATEPTEEPRRRPVPEREDFRENDALRESLATDDEEVDGTGGGDKGPEWWKGSEMPSRVVGLESDPAF